LNEVVRNITPSTTMGAVSIDSSTAVWKMNAGLSFATFCALTWLPG
jgi:hypothetical protein